ncbi:hypothetical protein PUR43_27225, partial [Enterobacter hormaechei subsp. xiangfangensis]|nr:hypothetical protein [Enterobacter hormaechei subsp. xiangfangensis]
MLEDLVAAAFNDAARRIDETQASLFFHVKDYNRKSDSRSNGANTLFIQIGVEEPAQG